MLSSYCYGLKAGNLLRPTNAETSLRHFQVVGVVGIFFPLFFFPTQVVWKGWKHWNPSKYWNVAGIEQYKSHTVAHKYDCLLNSQGLHPVRQDLISNLFTWYSWAMLFYIPRPAFRRLVPLAPFFRCRSKENLGALAQSQMAELGHNLPHWSRSAGLQPRWFGKHRMLFHPIYNISLFLLLEQ